jgi:hypothetical protein
VQVPSPEILLVTEILSSGVKKLEFLETTQDVLKEKRVT